jgi:hypothetical protein
LFKYGNWGNGSPRVRICPQDCKGWRGDVSKVHSWFVKGYSIHCETEVGVDANGKIIQIERDNEFYLFRLADCDKLIDSGQWSPNVSPDWYSSHAWLLSWIGRQIDEVIKRWGQPTEIAEYDRKYMKYSWRAQEGSLTCSVSFRVDDQGKIRGHHIPFPTECAQMKSVKAKWRAAPEAPPAKKPAI